jgi:hypothetical protein
VDFLIVIRCANNAGDYYISHHHIDEKRRRNTFDFSQPSNFLSMHQPCNSTKSEVVVICHVTPPVRRSSKFIRCESSGLSTERAWQSPPKRRPSQEEPAALWFRECYAATSRFLVRDKNSSRCVLQRLKLFSDDYYFFVFSDSFVSSLKR